MSEKEPHIVESSSRRLIPLTRWSSFHSWPQVGGLRHLVFYEKTNGFGSCLVRVGRRVLIDEARFFEWVDSQKMKGESK